MERVPTKRLIYEFDLKYDRFRSESKKNLRLEDKLNRLNEAMMILFEKRVELAEVNDEARNSLKPFEEKEKELKILERKTNYVIADFPKSFYKLLRQRVIASKDCLVKKKEFPILIFQSDKLDSALKNPFWKPTYEWEHTLGDEGRKGLYVWNNNEFKIDSIITDYLRKPEELHAPSMSEKGQYEDWNGIIRKKDVNCEFSQNFDHIKIVDIAVLLARADIGDIKDLNASINSIVSIDKIKF